jgi:hypothetical protein
VSVLINPLNPIRTNVYGTHSAQKLSPFLEEYQLKIRSQAIFIRSPLDYRYAAEISASLATLAFSAHFSSSSPCFQPSSRFTAGLVNENREFRVVILSPPPPHCSLSLLSLSVSLSPLFVAERAAAEALLPGRTQTDRQTDMQLSGIRLTCRGGGRGEGRTGSLRGGGGGVCLHCLIRCLRIT